MIKIGIIGCGHWGPNYIRNFSQIKKSEVVVCCDLLKKNLNNLKNHFSSVEMTQDHMEVVKNRDLDAVVISTPAQTHYKIAKDALANNKHVLIEKPLTLKYEHSRRLVDLARVKKKILMVGHTFLFNPAVRKLKQYIKKGELGKVYYLHATRTHLGLIRNDVNASWDLVPHDISIFSYLLDKMPVSVSALGGSFLKQRKEDVVFINLVYPDGIIANVHASWADSNKVRETQVIGSRARVVFDDLNNLEKIKLYKKGVSVERTYPDFGEFQFMLRDGDIISPKIELSEPLKNQCLEFLNCIEKKKTPLTDGENGAEVVKVMCAVEKSLKQKGRPVKV